MIFKKLGIAVAAISLGGCMAAAKMEFAKIAQPTPLSTPMSAALECLAQYSDPSIRIAVGRIPDLTGKFSYELDGAVVTQGATNMMVSALHKAGVTQVNRTGAEISEWELSKAMDRILGEDRPTILSQGKDLVSVPYRVVNTGAFLGSTHYLGGAITSVDFDTASGGAELTVSGYGIGSRVYGMRTALDLSVTETTTTKVVHANTYEKKLYGIENKAGVFRLFSDDLVDLSGGNQINEPINLGIRYSVEAAAYDVVSKMYNTTACDSALPQRFEGDPQDILKGT